MSTNAQDGGTGAEPLPLLTEEQLLEYARVHGFELKQRKPPSASIPKGRFDEVNDRMKAAEKRVAELEDTVLILREALRLARQRQAIEERT